MIHMFNMSEPQVFFRTHLIAVNVSLCKSRAYVIQFCYYRHCMQKSVFQKRFQQRKRTSNFISFSETKGTTFSNLNNVKNGQTISRNKSISSLSIIGFLYCCEKLKLFPLLFQLRIINLFSPETVYNRYSVFYFENAL